MAQSLRQQYTLMFGVQVVAYHVSDSKERRRKVAVFERKISKMKRMRRWVMAQSSRRQETLMLVARWRTRRTIIGKVGKRGRVPLWMMIPSLIWRMISELVTRWRAMLAMIGQQWPEILETCQYFLKEVRMSPMKLMSQLRACTVRAPYKHVICA